MAAAVEIARSDMHRFLDAQGYQEIKLKGVKELVYAKVVDRQRHLCVRVYTSVVGETSRGVGEDAIRVQLVTKVGNDPKIIGTDKRVHRVEGWKKNLQDRLDKWPDQLGPNCPICGAATVQRRSGRGPFWGCCRYPHCKSVQPIKTAASNYRPQQKAPNRDELERGLDRHGLTMEDQILEGELANAQGRAERNLAEYLEHVKHKAAFAAYEAEQECKAYRDEMEEEMERLGMVDSDDPPPSNW